MEQKKALGWGTERQLRNGSDSNLKSVDIISPPCTIRKNDATKNDAHAAALAQAGAAGEWREWWRIYCETNGLPWPPTGRDVKLATMRMNDEGG